MNTITKTISAVSERHWRRVRWVSTRTTPTPSSGTIVLSLSLLKTVSPSRAIDDTTIALSQRGPRLSSPTTILGLKRPATLCGLHSGRPAGSGSLRRFVLGRRQRANPGTQILEDEREPDRCEQDGQEHDDRRRLLAAGRNA